MQTPFQTSRQTEGISQRQAELKAQTEVAQAERRQIEQDRHFRRGDPPIKARDAVISEIQQLTREIEKFREKQQEIRFNLWRLDEAASVISDVAELDEILPRKASLTKELEAIETEIKKRDCAIEYKGTIARDLLDAFDSLQLRRRQLLTRLLSAKGQERGEVERQLQKVVNRLRRFDSTAHNPLYCLAVSINGGDE